MEDKICFIWRRTVIKLYNMILSFNVTQMKYITCDNLIVIGLSLFLCLIVLQDSKKNEFT